MTGTATNPVLLLQVSVQSLHEGCPLTTEMTYPRFVVLVVSVHVVHQPSEPSALFLTELTDAELFGVLIDFSLGNFAHFSPWPWALFFFIVYF